eukprot:21025-Alexandrium_andersonii.AAC.1
MAVDQLLVDRLRHNVRRVLLARSLSQLEVSGPHSFLGPELPTANCRTSVRAHPQPVAHAQ